MKKVVAFYCICLVFGVNACDTGDGKAFFFD